ncbi:hypothetical protein MASR2M117_24180 [Paludibacter sp.]
MRKFISESFFNPVIHVIPILTFLLLETHYWNDLRVAWLISLPIAVLFAIYVYVFYSSLISWYFVSIAVYLTVAVIVSLTHHLFAMPFLVVYGKLVAIPFLLIPWIFKKYILMLVARISNKKLAMENNMNELITATNTIAIIFLCFSVLFLTAFLFVADDNNKSILYVIYYVYISSLILYFVFQTIRVFVVRNSLLKEEWVPIVNDAGKEIGSIDLQTSINNTGVKFTHPVARVVVMSENRLLLRKRTLQDNISPDTWDHAICTHVRYKEAALDAVNRSAFDLFGLKEVKPEFLANYKLENNFEYQFVHLYLSCKFSDKIFDSDSAKCQTKWWTLQQIQEELHSGIFSDNFIKEYDILNRSGLIMTGRCQCECKLRDQIKGAKNQNT